MAKNEVTFKRYLKDKDQVLHSVLNKKFIGKRVAAKKNLFKQNYKDACFLVDAQQDTML